MTRAHGRRPSSPHEKGTLESGQISVYLLGLTLVVIMLIVVTYAITALALARVRLLDAADAAALVAANAFDERAYSAHGVRAAVPLSDATVQAAASENLAMTQLPPTFQGWSVAAGTGTPDGETAVVVLSARVHLPLVGALVGDRATVGLSVEARARAATT